jgi:ferredoxin
MEEPDMGSAMIVFDRETCTGCGEYVKICHEHCISLVDRKVNTDCDFCSTCAQRVAVGPQPALAYDGTARVSDDDLLLPSAEGRWDIPVFPGCSQGSSPAFRLLFRRSAHVAYHSSVIDYGRENKEDVDKVSSWGKSTHEQSIMSHAGIPGQLHALSLGRGGSTSADEQPHHDSARTTEHERRIET